MKAPWTTVTGLLSWNVQKLLQNNCSGRFSMDPKLFYHGKIFIIDDDLANTRLLEKVLTRGGYENLSVTTDSRRVIAMVMDDDPDLLLLDLHMPHLDGYKILGLLGELIPVETFLPVIVLTADLTPQAKNRALAAGAIDFLSKPFDLRRSAPASGKRITDALFAAKDAERKCHFGGTSKRSQRVTG